MTESYSPSAAVNVSQPPPDIQLSPHEEAGTTDVVKAQAAAVGQTAGQAGQHVADVAQEQSAQVVAEAGRQAKDLLTQAQAELRVQVGAQQQKAVGELRSLSAELQSMSSGVENPGIASDFARQGSARADAIASWLDGREPAAIVNDVSNFARRRPGAFLAIAGGLGFFAGRLTRGLKAQSEASKSDSRRKQPVAPVNGLTADPSLAATAAPLVSAAAYSVDVR